MRDRERGGARAALSAHVAGDDILLPHHALPTPHHSPSIRLGRCLRPAGHGRRLRRASRLRTGGGRGRQSPLRDAGDRRRFRCRRRLGTASELRLIGQSVPADSTGRAVRAALEHRGLWSSIEPRLVVGENASQAVQFALSGGTEGGIVPYSLILAPRIAPLGTGALIPRSWHSPIRHRVVLLDSASADAGALYRFLQQGEARAILERYGFIVPEGEQ
jgi:hypothetical protein